MKFHANRENTLTKLLEEKSRKSEINVYWHWSYRQNYPRSFRGGGGENALPAFTSLHQRASLQKIFFPTSKKKESPHDHAQKRFLSLSANEWESLFSPSMRCTWEWAKWAGGWELSSGKKKDRGSASIWEQFLEWSNNSLHKNSIFLVQSTGKKII